MPTPPHRGFLLHATKLDARRLEDNRSFLRGRKDRDTSRDEPIEYLSMRMAETIVFPRRNDGDGRTHCRKKQRPTRCIRSVVPEFQDIRAKRLSELKCDAGFSRSPEVSGKENTGLSGNDPNHDRCIVRVDICDVVLGVENIRIRAFAKLDTHSPSCDDPIYTPV